VDGSAGIEVGDWVRTPAGHEGRVEHKVRLSAYVRVGNGGPETLKAFLLSQLEKIDAPRSTHGS
jgi:hypothetical protein